ncbi:MAG: type I-E CRISPR-associated protein Cse1/CasA [Candidatus Thorarchaeota archaeon]
MDIEYNLLKEPWINAMDLTGKTCVMGIEPLLKRAHELREIIDSSPVIQYSIYRFLIAFVMDAFTIQDIEDIELILDNGQLDKEIINNYIKKWYNRFDLFDSEHPFYQSPPSQYDPSEVKDVSELFMQFPTGVSPIHFYHMKSEEHAISPEICAKGLCTIPAFALQGGAGYSPGINGTPPWYILVTGKNLYETLVLNSCGMPIAEASGSGSVAWRNDEPLIPKKEVKEVSILKGLTFQPRFIRLIPTEGGICSYMNKDSKVLVRDIYYQPGLKWRGDWRDPHVAYSYGKTIISIRPQKGREIWRDTGPLALLKRKESNNIKFDRPVIVTQFKTLQEKLILEEEKSLDLQVYGIRAKQKKIYEWQYTHLTLPIKLILSEESGIVLQNAMERAEKVYYALKSAIKIMHPGEAKRNTEEQTQKKKKKIKKGSEKLFDKIQDRATRRFWKALEPQFKGKFLIELARVVETSNWGPVELMWLEDLRNIGNQILRETIGPLDTDADFIKRQVQAEQKYSIFTYKIFKELIEQNKTKKEEK